MIYNVYTESYYTLKGELCIVDNQIKLFILHEMITQS
jgi:hypothetical protein